MGNKSSAVKTIAKTAENVVARPRAGKENMAGDTLSNSIKPQTIADNSSLAANSSIPKTIQTPISAQQTKGSSNGDITQPVNTSAGVQRGKEVFDPELLKQISKWSVEKSAAVRTQSAPGSLVAVKRPAVAIRQQEQIAHQVVIDKGMSIPGRLTGKEIVLLLEKYRLSENKPAEIESLAKLFRLEVSVVESLVRWNRFSLVARNKNNDLIGT